MDEMLTFANEKAARKGYHKFFSKSEDIAAVKALDIQLTHAFQIFQVCCHIFDGGLIMYSHVIDAADPIEHQHQSHAT